MITLALIISIVAFIALVGCAVIGCGIAEIGFVLTWVVHSGILIPIVIASCIIAITVAIVKSFKKK